MYHISGPSFSFITQKHEICGKKYHEKLSKLHEKITKTEINDQRHASQDTNFENTV